MEEKGFEWNDRFIPFCKIEYLYDNNGNQVEKRILKTHRRGQAERTTYDYDYENRLIKITYADFGKGWGSKVATSEYEYDGVGRRIKVVEDKDVTIYLYDGLNAIIEKNSNGYTQAYYTRGLSYGGGIGGIISSTRLRPFRKDIPKGWEEIEECEKREDKTFTTYYHYDGLGSVTNLTSSRSYNVAEYEYDAYGNILSIRGLDFSNPYRFSTKEYSSRSGLIYFGARYYDPRVGRWITADPLTWRPDDPRNFEMPPNSLITLMQQLIWQSRGRLNSTSFNIFNSFGGVQKALIFQIGAKEPRVFNRYIYCFSNPINFIDPFGLTPWFKQFLSELSKYSTITAIACYYGGVKQGVMVFGGIAAFSKGLEISIYSHTPITDTVIEVIKSLVGKIVGEAPSMFTDEIIDQTKREK